MKRPAFQFYPGDWLRDTPLQTCSLAAQGLWINLLCRMHDGRPYGHLAVVGTPIPERQLARMIGIAYTTFRPLLRELERAQVLARTNDGIALPERPLRVLRRR